jgi:hypothetical protein
MKLMTKALEARFAELGEQDTPDAIVVAKFFSPTSNWTWYATAYYPEDRLAFGLVMGFERELGYFSIDELESVQGPLGIGIERDRHFREIPLKDVVAKLEAGVHV